MTCLSTFSFPCWINPSSPVVNQVFGMSSGMGLLPITFDCKYHGTLCRMPIANSAIGSQISYIGSPLLVPTWAIVNVFAALVFGIWIIGSALYYSNVWSTAYLPFQSSSGRPNLPSVLEYANNVQFSITKERNTASKRCSMQPLGIRWMSKLMKLIPLYVNLFCFIQAALIWIDVLASHIRLEYIRIGIRNSFLSRRLDDARTEPVHSDGS